MSREPRTLARGYVTCVEQRADGYLRVVLSPREGAPRTILLDAATDAEVRDLCDAMSSRVGTRRLVLDEGLPDTRDADLANLRTRITEAECLLGSQRATINALTRVVACAAHGEPLDLDALAGHVAEDPLNTMRAALANVPVADDAGSLHAQIAGLERALANAESASDRIVAAMRHVADGGPLDHAVMRGVRIDALNVLHRLHPQPPHAGAADVERAPLLSIVGRLYYASDRMQVLDLDGGDLLASVVLPPGVVRAYGGGQPVRLTVNVPPQREGDAAGGQSVPDEREQQERGEGVGGVHGGNVGEGGGAREVP